MCSCKGPAPGTICGRLRSYLEHKLTASGIRDSSDCAKSSARLYSGGAAPDERIGACAYVLNVEGRRATSPVVLGLLELLGPRYKRVGFFQVCPFPPPYQHRHKSMPPDKPIISTNTQARGWSGAWRIAFRLYFLSCGCAQVRRCASAVVCITILQTQSGTSAELPPDLQCLYL